MFSQESWQMVKSYPPTCQHQEGQSSSFPQLYSYKPHILPWLSRAHSTITNITAYISELSKQLL